MENYICLPRVTNNTPVNCSDSVYLYATEVLSLGMIWHGYHDSTKEFDGDRLLMYWKVLAQLFKSTNHRNYAKDAVNLLYQYHYKMSERQKEQLMWSRCINTRGVPGANIPCDLHMEHLNRRLKTVIRNMGANKSSSSIKRAIGAVHHVCAEFEAQTANQIHSDHHPIPSFGDGFSTILYQLTTALFHTNVPSWKS